MRAGRILSFLGIALLCSCAIIDPASAQRLGQGESVDVPIWRVVGALLFCLLIAVGAAFLLKRRLHGNVPMVGARGRRLQLVETLRLSHQNDICLISCDGVETLVASGSQGLTLMYRLAPEGDKGGDAA